MDVREGVLRGALPNLTIGSGPPLVLLRGLSADHHIRTGFDRRAELGIARPLAGRFTVHVVSRRVGLTAGTTMADLAADVAVVLRENFDGPVAVMGVSTGGAIAQQLAVDHPELVARLVVAASAARLSPFGLDAQRRLAEVARSGKKAKAGAASAYGVAATRIGGWVLGAVMWATAPFTAPADPGDMIATIEADDAFDITGDLHRIRTPTLVVAGERDHFYPPELVRETADRIPGARLCLYPRKGHASLFAHRQVYRDIMRFLREGTGPAGGA